MTEKSQADSEPMVKPRDYCELVRVVQEYVQLGRPLKVGMSLAVGAGSPDSPPTRRRCQIFLDICDDAGYLFVSLGIEFAGFCVM